MMDGSFIEKLQEIINGRVQIEVGGKKFSSLPMKPVFHQPRPDTLKVRTLTSIQDYLEDNRDGLDLGNLILHVNSPTGVTLMSKFGGEDLKRDEYLFAEHDGAVFKFGTWMGTEEFIIAANSLFVPTPELKELLTFISKIKISEDGEIADDGISQSVSVRVGVKGGLTESATPSPRIRLMPFRTFREIEQPESEFLFRMRKQGDGVALSLHEADGGMWRHEAMQRVASWLTTKIPGVSVIA